MNLKNIFAVTILGLAFAAPQAQATTLYDFSFSNINGATNGTVSGSITLPDGDGTFAASLIEVTSAPASLGYTTPYDVLANMFVVFVNSFTVSGGAINPLSSSFGAQNATEAFLLNFSGLGTALSPVGAASFNGGVWDTNNSTLSYDASSSVPVPATLPLFAIGGAAMTFRRRNKAAA